MPNFAKLKNYSLTNNKFFWWLLFGLIVFAWWKFRLGFLAPRSGDAWIYWYAGKEILNGNLPYRDFFYSSPPLIPYFTALWQMFFGFNLTAALIVPQLITIISSFLIFTFFSLQRQFQAGLLAAITFLFAGVVFAHADFLLGATILTPFVILGLIFFQQKRFFFAGIFFGLAALTKLYGIIPAIFLLPLLKNRKAFFSFILGGFVSFGIPNLFFWLTIGGKYLDLIFFNHFAKPVSERASIFLALLKYNSALVVTLGVGFWLQQKNALLKPAVISSVGILIFCAFFNEIFYFYFQPLAAILAILLGQLFLEKNPGVKKFILPLILITLVFSSLYSVWDYYKVDGNLGQIADLEQMLQILERETKPSEAIWGIGNLTPLLALMANRQIFEHDFDTYAKWETIGIASTEKRLRNLSQTKVPLVITGENSIKSSKQIYSEGELLPKKFLLKNCRIIQKFGYNEFTFWKCFAESRK
ncbi:MAG: glycosyltransferase family 39 protein [Patescibacteria group bacterium]